MLKDIHNKITEREQEHAAVESGLIALAEVNQIKAESLLEAAKDFITGIRSAIENDSFPIEDVDRVSQVAATLAALTAVAKGQAPKLAQDYGVKNLGNILALMSGNPQDQRAQQANAALAKLGMSDAMNETRETFNNYLLRVREDPSAKQKLMGHLGKLRTAVHDKTLTMAKSEEPSELSGEDHSSKYGTIRAMHNQM